MKRSSGIDVGAHDLTAVVEAQGLGRRAGDVDRGEAAVVEQEAVAAAARVFVVAQDLAAGVDPQRKRPRGARDVDRRVAPAVEDEPVDGEAGGVMGADDLAPVVDAVGRGLQDSVWMVDGGELPPG